MTGQASVGVVALRRYRQACESRRAEASRTASKKIWAKRRATKRYQADIAALGSHILS
jgi:hypothetical protein